MKALRQDAVSREDSVRALERIFDYYRSLLPEGLTYDERENSLKRLSTSGSGAIIHILALYQKGYALGENLSGLTAYSHDRIYQFYLTALARHLMDAPAELKQANFIARAEGTKRELRNYIAAVSPQTRRG